MEKIEIIQSFSQLLVRAQNKSVWDLGNKTLYQLCENNFKHENDEAIIAKVWLIGRSYAAAIERGRKSDEKNLSNDEFYKKVVTKAFKELNLDSNLEKLSNLNISIENIPAMLHTHKSMLMAIKGINSRNLRSFASKYLHFHLPGHFFIYDSRASMNIKKFVKKVPRYYKANLSQESIDKEYGEFYYKCFALQRQIEENTGVLVTPRELDNLLLEN